MSQEKITLAITGASGVQYALVLLEQLLKQGHEVHLMISDAARVVIATETELKLPRAPASIKKALINAFNLSETSPLRVYSKDNWMSPVASGSSSPKKMVICPCSTGSLAAISLGQSDNLIERAADVVLKERGTLILVPRETPLSTIHLENMLRLSKMGAVILPSMPGFYQKPETIQDMIHFIVARVLQQLDLPQNLMQPWGYMKSQEISEK